MEDGEIALGEDGTDFTWGERGVLEEVPIAGEAAPERGEGGAQFVEGRHDGLDCGELERGRQDSEGR